MHVRPFDAWPFRSRPSSRSSDWWRRLTVRLRWAFGVLLSINFALFWALPIAIQGQSYKLGLRRVLDPIYDWLDSPPVRRFAARWVYQRPVHADYFVRAVLLLMSTAIAVGVVTWWR